MKYNIIINIKSLSNTTCIPSHWRKRINIPCLQQNSISVQASRFQSLRDFFLTFEMWSPEPGTSWCSSPGRKPGSRAYEGRHTGSGDIWLGSGVSAPSWHQDDLLLLGSMMFPELLCSVFSVVSIHHYHCVTVWQYKHYIKHNQLTHSSWTSNFRYQQWFNLPPTT